VRILGVDFTCAPRPAKPIVVAVCDLKKDVLEVSSVEPIYNFPSFEKLLQEPGPWIGGFDFPFGLPRELVRDLGWPRTWRALVGFCANLTRGEFRAILDAYRATRPVGSKYAHRRTDLPAGSSSPMKLVNPPVALMFHEGAPRLLTSGVQVPALFEGDSKRVALEAYPGLLVRKQLGIRESYKSDTRSEQTPARAAARGRIVGALKGGRPLGVKLKTRADLVADGSGDTLDAAICAVQAAWAAGRPGYGIPDDPPDAEGWIITA
jgi:hypothetical protein